MASEGLAVALCQSNDVLVHGIQRSPSEGNGYYGLAILRFRQQRLSEAEQWARKAHSLVHRPQDRRCAAIVPENLPQSFRREARSVAQGLELRPDDTGVHLGAVGCL